MIGFIKIFSMLEFLYSLTLIEVVIGGGGRMAGFSPVSVRGVLASICCLVALLDFMKGGTRVSPDTKILIFLFVFCVVLGAFVGYASGNDIGAVMGDVAQVSFFMTIIFFQRCFDYKKTFSLTDRFLVYSTVGMAVCYLVVLFFIFEMGKFDPIYQFLSTGDDFFFRENGTFFYKGFPYLGVALFFLVERINIWKLIGLVIVGAAILLCNTRGMYLAIAITVFLLYFRVEVKFFVIVFAVIVFLFWGEGQMLGAVAKPDSDVVRLQDLTYIFDDMNFFSVVFGHGFGAEINGRNRIEIAWAEVFYKQGLVGLGFWLYWVFSLSSYFISLRGWVRKVARPYFASALFIFALSFTNPFMNNSIGLVVLLVAHFSLVYLRGQQYRMLSEENRLRRDVEC